MRPLLLTAGILLAFAFLDYQTPQLMSKGPSGFTRDCLVAAAIGVCIAQVTLIAAWAVFAPGNIVVRLPWSLLLGLMMWYVLAWSEGRAFPSSRANDTTNLGISVLLGVVVLQFPLWIAKRAFRYRMIQPGEEPAPTAAERLQFQLKHMLLGTTVFAVALSPLRFVLPKEGLHGYRPEWELYVVLTIGICVNLVATLPCFWLGFVSNARAVFLGLFWLVYCLLVTVLEFTALCIALRGPPDWKEEFLLFFLVNVSQGAVVFGVMRSYRALGYRLLRAPRTLPLLPECLAEAEDEAAAQSDGEANGLRARPTPWGV